MNYTLITGATSGIGFEFAKLLAKDGRNLILVSSNIKSLNNTKRELDKKYSVSIKVIEQDLAKKGSAIDLFEKIISENIVVNTLINNAGFGLIGDSASLDFERDEEQIMVNIVSLTQLTKLFLKEMKKTGTGRILNISSTGAFQPGPYTATYFASKAYVLNYTRAVRHEVMDTDIIISTLCPGSTKTKFFNKAGQATPKGAMSPKRVAKSGLKGLDKNKEIIIPGIINKLMRIIPMNIKIKAIGKIKNK